MRKLIIDTDPGVDDALALFYAFGTEAFHLVGLTTIFGNVKVERASANALWLTEVSRLGGVPVATGAAQPLGGGQHVPSVHVHGPEGFGHFIPPQPSHQVVPQDAADFLIEQSRRLEGELEVIALGPLTNLALAAERDPTFPARLKALYIMGGAFHATGNVSPFAEANIHNDPEAAAVVAREYPHAHWIGLDVTDRIPLSWEATRELAASAGTLEGFVRDCTEFYLDFYKSMGFEAGGGLHDPATIIAALHPEFFTFEMGNVTVECADRERRGDTNIEIGAGSARVALDMDTDAILNEFMTVTSRFLGVIGGADKAQ